MAILREWLVVTNLIARGLRRKDYHPFVDYVKQLTIKISICTVI
jgi:hypothetical protein